MSCSQTFHEKRGDLTLDTIGDLLCGGIVCHGSVFNPLLTISLFSTARGEKDGYLSEMS